MSLDKLRWSTLFGFAALVISLLALLVAHTKWRPPRTSMATPPSLVQRERDTNDEAAMRREWRMRSRGAGRGMQDPGELFAREFEERIRCLEGERDLAIRAIESLASTTDPKERTLERLKLSIAWRASKRIREYVGHRQELPEGAPPEEVERMEEQNRIREEAEDFLRSVQTVEVLDELARLVKERMPRFVREDGDMAPILEELTRLRKSLND